MINHSLGLGQQTGHWKFPGASPESPDVRMLMKVFDHSGRESESFMNVLRIP